MIENIKERVDYNILKKSFLYTYILGLVTHAFAFFNLSISHDSLDEFYSIETWAKANLGRFFYPIYISFTRGRIVLPWLIGILALCWISLVVYFIVKILGIEKATLVLLISGICVTNPTVYALTATYIHDLDADMFAMLLSVISVCLWNEAMRHSGTKGSFLFLCLGAVILSISLGIYQSYISVAITLIMIVCIQRLLEQRNYKNILLQGVQGIAYILLAAILYIVEAKIFSEITGVNILNNNSYNGLGGLKKIFSGNFFDKFIGTYKTFVETFENMILTSYPAKVFWSVPTMLFICIVTMFIIIITKNKWQNSVLTTLLAIFLPFGMNISYFISSGMVHMLMQYAVWMVLLLAVMLIQFLPEKRNIKKVMYCMVLVCGFLMITENIQTANTIYVKKELEYQSTLSYMTRVADRMEMQEEYIPGETPVLIIGKNIGEPKSGFERYSYITGVGINGSITYYDTYDAYFEYVLGRPINSIENDELKYSSEVYTMPVFPDKNSIRMVEGTLVVKMK